MALLACCGRWRDRVTEHLTLPETWQNVPLSACLELNQSGTWGNEPRGDDTDVPVLRSTNIQDGQMVLDNLAYRSVSPTVISRFALSEGDILITKSSGSPQLIGKNIMFVPPGDEKIYLFSNFTQRLRSNQGLLVPEYLYYFLNSHFAQHFLQRIQSTTSGLRNLDMNLYASQLIPLPPLSEQRHIAAILHEANELRRQRRKANERARDLLPAIFSEVFGDIESYPARPLSQLCHFITKGTTPKPEDIMRELKGDAVPFIKVLHITDDGDIDLETDPAFIDTRLHNGLLKRSKVFPGDVLMNIVGPPLGKIGIVPNSYKEWNINQALVFFRPREGISTSFLFHILRHPVFLERMIKQAVGVRQLNLNLEQCRNFEVPLPPLELRQRFEKLAGELSLLSTGRVSSGKTLAQLLQSLLARAFSGELTAVWREEHTEQLRDEAVQRDIALGLRGVEPTLDDLEAGRVTKVEQEEADRLLAQALEQFRAIPSTAFQGLITETFGDVPTISIEALLGPQSQMLETLRVETSELFTEQLRPVAQALAQRLVQYTEGLAQLQAEALRQPMLQPAPELTRQLAAWFSGIGRLGEIAQALAARKPLRDALGSDIAALLDTISAAPAYFRAEMLVNDAISLIQVEEGLRLLGALGIVRPVQVRGQAGYRLVSREREQAVPEGLGL